MAASRRLLDDLKQLKCIRLLSPAAIHLLETAGVRVELKSKSILWEMGEPAEFFSVILNGTVQIIRTTEREDLSIIGLFGPSNAIGLSAALAKSTYPGTAIALSPGAVVAKFCIRRILAGAPTESNLLQTWIRELLLQHEQIVRDKIDILNSGAIDFRVFEFLNHLDRRFGQFTDETKRTIPISLTRFQISQMVNSRLETVIRILNNWRKLNLVTWNKTEILVKNKALLELHIKNRRHSPL